MNLSPSDAGLANECADVGAAVERASIITFIETRAAAARKLGRRGQLSDIEAAEHGRWLDTLAGDIRAGLHTEGA